MRQAQVLYKKEVAGLLTQLDDGLLPPSLALIEASFLNEKSKRNYIQGYQTRLKKLLRP